MNNIIMHSVRTFPRPLQIRKVVPFERPKNPALDEVVRGRLFPFLSQLGEDSKEILKANVTSARELDNRLQELGIQRIKGKGMVERFLRLIEDCSSIAPEKVRELKKNSAILAPLIRQVIEQSGIYFGHQFRPPFLMASGDLVGIVDVSYLGFETRAYTAKVREKRRVACLSPHTIGFYSGNLPDFLSYDSEEGDRLKNLARELARRTTSIDYFVGSEAVADLEKLGIDPALFAEYIIHEMRHSFNYGETKGAEFSGSEDRKILSILELGFPKSSGLYMTIAAFDEATAYLSPMIDGPNPYFSVGRMFTLITDRPKGYDHRDGSIVALVFLCEELNIDRKLINPQDQESMFVAMEKMASVDSTTLRMAADSTLRKLYNTFYGIDDSNTF